MHSAHGTAGAEGTSRTVLLSGVATVVLAWVACVGGCPVNIPGLLPPPSEPPPETPPPSGVGNSGLTGKFVGPSDCRICHQRIYNDWSLTAHARAYEVLEELGQQNNELCLTCHATGFRQEGGFTSRALTNDLAAVTCEACHGPGKDHRSNVSDRSLRPPKSMSAQVCAQCHNGYHHNTFDEWKESRHGRVTGSESSPASPPASYFAQGRNLTTCGPCHSGDFRQRVLIDGLAASDTQLSGVAPEDMNSVTCAVCHDPHARTANTFMPRPGFDGQLRYPEIAFPAASNALADAINPARFNLCGQCHHSRDRVWTANDRGPHDSVQANFYVGEMPVPDGTQPLLPNERTVHAFVPKQCVTCHMQHHDFIGGTEGQTHPGHQFAIVSTAGCSTTGCHPSPESAEADKERLQAEIQAGLDAIAARLGPINTWEYSAYGGPNAQGQAGLSNTIKQIRFLYHYVLADGSRGVHNPEYARAILRKCDELLTSIGK